MPNFKCDIFGDFQILCVRGAANTKHDKLQHFEVIESNTFGQSIEASLERRNKIRAQLECNSGTRLRTQIGAQL